MFRNRGKSKSSHDLSVKRIGPIGSSGRVVLVGRWSHQLVSVEQHVKSPHLGTLLLVEE